VIVPYKIYIATTKKCIKKIDLYHKVI